MSDKLIEKLRQIALNSAKPEAGKYRMAAAVLDRKGKILAIGTNSYVKTHPTQAKYAEKADVEHKTFLHAEISALVKVKTGDPYKIAVVRVGNNGELRLARPCRICEMAIKQAGIKVVEFTM
jgi:tRNA(Arg) A34 adenosine deaminase TadA